MELQHEELESLLGAYALDAVDDDERAAVEAHLATCPRCRAEVDDHREVAAHLAQTGAPAPDGLWDRIAGAIDDAAPPPLRLAATPPPARPRRWYQRPPLAAAAAAVVAVGLMSLGAALDDDGGGDRDAGLDEAALAALQSPDARLAELVDDDGTVLARAAVLDDGHGYLLAGALPDLDERIYQLWGSNGRTVVSLGALGGAPQVVAFTADPTQTTLMITEEDAPVERTENTPVVVGDLA